MVARLEGLHSVLPSDGALDTPERIEVAIQKLRNEAVSLQREIDRVDELVEMGEVKDYMKDRKAAQAILVNERDTIGRLESAEKNLEFELREIREFVAFLAELTEKVGFAEATFDAIGSIEFTHCPACGEELEHEAPSSHCVVCKSPWIWIKKGRSTIRSVLI